MVSADTVRAVALGFPEVKDRSKQGLAFYVSGKLLAWSWPERTGGKGPARPNLRVLAVHCPTQDKQRLLEAIPETLFTTPHYDGYPVVLVRLDAVDEAQLRDLLGAAWTCLAPPI